MERLNQLGARTVFRALALLALLTLLGCTGSGTPSTDLAPRFVVLQPGSPTGGNEVAGQFVLPQPRSPIELPPAASAALGGIALPALPAGPDGGKGASVALPYSMPGDQLYAPGDGGSIGGAHVSFPGPPFGGAELNPPGTSFPDNFAYVLYRIDDVPADYNELQLTFGLSLGEVGVAAYNWAYGAAGQWAPLFYGPAGGNVNVQLGGFPGEDFTNANDDLALLVFCINPAQANVSSMTVTGGGGVTYDEVEPNSDFSVGGSQPLPANDVLGLTGNVGEGGPYDGSVHDIWNFTANVGDTYAFTINYDNAAAEILIGLVDQEWVDTQGGVPELASAQGQGANFSYTITGLEVQPIYFIIQNYNDPAPPHTDYQLDIDVPGGGGGGYDEIEPNSDPSEAQALPQWDFSGFSGNVGTGGPHDGSEYDYYEFTANVGDTFTFAFDYTDPGAEIFIGLLDSNFNLLTNDAGDGSHAEFTYTVDGTEAQPLYFGVQNLDPFPATDYTLSVDGPDGGGGGYDEVEDNDDVVDANLLTFPVSGFTGNAGTGGPNDGDIYDIYTYSATTGDTVSFDVTYDPAADYDATEGAGVAVFIFDQEYWDTGSGLFIGVGGSGGFAQVSHTFDGTETGPFYFVVQDDTDKSPFPPPTDYSIDATGP